MYNKYELTEEEIKEYLKALKKEILKLNRIRKEYKSIDLILDPYREEVLE